jgi:hypothetical protein
VTIPVWTWLLKNSFQLVGQSLVASTPLGFNNLVRKTLKVILRTIGYSTNHPL